jgi:hypothetical protein
MLSPQHVQLFAWHAVRETFQIEEPSYRATPGSRHEAIAARSTKISQTVAKRPPPDAFTKSPLPKRCGSANIAVSDKLAKHHSPLLCRRSGRGSSCVIQARGYACCTQTVNHNK